jgi:YVTN family beta-propeller protein
VELREVDVEVKMKKRSLVWSVLGAAVLLACAGSRASLAVEPNQGTNLLYVCNQAAATISVIDMDRNIVVKTIDLQALGLPATSKPHHVQVEPDGSYYYVSLIGANTVLKFDRSDELVGRVEFEVPGLLQLDVHSDRLYVGRSMAAVNPPQRIGVIDRVNMTIEEIDVFYARPHALAVARDGATIYSASLAENRMASIDAEAEEVELLTLEGPLHTLVQFAISPDGKTMVAGGQMSGQLLVFSLEDAATPRVVRAVPVNAQPWHPTFTHDGRYVYIGNQEANTITVIDTRSWTVAKVLEGNGIAQPHGTAVSPDGATVYVSNKNLRGEYPGRGGTEVGTVVAIDVATQSVKAIIETGEGSAGIGTRAWRP